MKKIYVITGATSGIGNALTQYFTKQGHTVFAGYRNSEKLNLIPENAIPFYINSNDENSIVEASNFIKSQTNKVDTLINVSGCVVAGIVETISTQELRRQFDVNVFSHILLSQNLLDLLEYGKIINISSMSSFGIFPFVAPYGASKRALDILFQAMQLETKRHIQIISVKPGVIATPLWEKSITENQNSFEKCKTHEKEMSFMINNARKNGQKGLSITKLVDKIVKIDNSNNPKPSYTIGFDAKVAEFASHLPLGILNKIIKLKLNKMSK